MLLETVLDQDNDPIVYLTDKNGIWSFHKLCDLIAKTFLGYDPDNFNTKIEHIDWNKENNRADNLRIVYISD